MLFCPLSLCSSVSLFNRDSIPGPVPVKYDLHFSLYRPLRSCGKVMFLHLCVILFTRGISVPTCTTGHMTRGSLSRGSLCGRSLSGGSLSRGLYLGVSVQGVSVCPGGSLSGMGSVQGALCPGGLCQGDPRMITHGWYASYWNAYLL